MIRLLVLLIAMLSMLARAQSVGHVILVSVDGLRGDAIAALGPERLPNLFRLRREGAWTDNARTDADHTVTLPNHIAMITGRPAGGERGHGWAGNGTPGPNETIHSRKGVFVPSVFDIVHEWGLGTALYAGKPKFVLFEQSYGEWIDALVLDSDTPTLIDGYLQALAREQFGFSFIHLRDPDGAGHGWGFTPEPGSAYAAALSLVDGQMARLLATIEATEGLRGTTIVILTSDHGGNGVGHGTATNPDNFVIPFYVWGAGVAMADLYALNADRRVDPDGAHLGLDAAPPPIRNGDAANLALRLLGLPPLPGSSIGAADPLRVR